MTYAIAVPPCPKCGGAMWDNRPDKKNPKGPDFKCKDKGCLDDKGFGTALWERDLKKNGVAPKPDSKTPQAFSTGGYIPGVDDEPAESGTVFPKIKKALDVYTVCFDHAHELAKKHYGNDESHEATAAMAATIFIQMCNKGITV
jgi:hypothetical protein